MSDRQPTLRRGRGAFSRVLDVKDVRDDALRLSIEATPEEREAIAAEIDLPGLDAFEASFVLYRRAGGRIEAEGDLKAEVVERCVVTLEPFKMHLDQAIEIAFAPARQDDVPPERGARGGRRAAPAPVPAKPVTVAGNDDQEDPPDPIVDDRIDLGAVAVEFLSLARDPYPKKSGVHFKDVVSDENAASEPSALAAALERFKDRP